MGSALAVLLCVVAGAAMGWVNKGPCYGCAYGALIGVFISALHASLVSQLGTLTRMQRAAVQGVAVLLTICVSYAALRPPTARNVLERIGIPACEISDALICHEYG